MIIKNIKLIQFDTVNKNGVTYSKDAMEKALISHIDGNPILGQIGGYEFNYRLHLSNISHRIDNVNIQDDGLYGDVNILETPNGEILKSLLETGMTFYFGPNGVGSINENGEVANYTLTSINVFEDEVFPECNLKL